MYFCSASDFDPHSGSLERYIFLAFLCIADVKGKWNPGVLSMDQNSLLYIYLYTLYIYIHYIYFFSFFVLQLCRVKCLCKTRHYMSFSLTVRCSIVRYKHLPHTPVGHDKDVAERLRSSDRTGPHRPLAIGWWLDDVVRLSTSRWGVGFSWTGWGVFAFWKSAPHIQLMAARHFLLEFWNALSKLRGRHPLMYLITFFFNFEWLNKSPEVF